MAVLDGNFAVGCGPGKDYPQIHIFQCMLERTDAIRIEVLEPITFVLAYPTLYATNNGSYSFPVGSLNLYEETLGVKQKCSLGVMHVFRPKEYVSKNF